MSKVEDENYYQIAGWMLNQLHLKGAELNIYAIIYGFTQSVNSFSGSLSYLEDFTNSTKPTVIKALKSLTEKGLLIKELLKTEKGICVIYKTVKNFDMVKNLYSPGKETLLGGKETLPPPVNNLYSPGKETLPNNNIYTNTDNDINNNKDTYNKNQKHKFGEYKNVLLTDEEKKKLDNLLGIEKADAVIQNYSELKEMKGYKYKSDYLALMKWGISAFENKQPSNPYQQKGFDKSNLENKDFWGE